MVGHSLVPPHLLPIEGARVDIYRSPGAKAANFETDTRLANVLGYIYDLVIVFLGGNDVHNDCVPSQITDNIKCVIEQIHANCYAQIAFILLEHRVPKPGNRFNIDVDQYNKVSNNINNRLKRAYKRKPYVQFLSIGAKPFRNNLTDGVHFNDESKLHLRLKLINTITRFVANK